MAEHSKIEWTDHTFNPWIGCTKVSAACDHCYAEVATPTRTLRASGAETWGPHAPRKRTSAANWKLPHKWNRQAEAEGRRYRVFCASLADVFDNHASIQQEWRDELWHMIHQTPHLDWLLLTKRPQNIARFMPNYSHTQREWPNVWLGTTVENQTEADRRIPHLLAAPAAVRFLSVEPMLGPVDLGGYLPDLDCGDGIDWVICGGESGPKARPMHPQSARDLRDQCIAAGTRFFFKQWGDWGPTERSDEIDIKITMPGQNATLWAWPDGKTKDSWKRGPVSVRLGKRAAGRLLDGREWNEMPEVQHG